LSLLYELLERSVLDKVRPTEEEYEKLERVYGAVKRVVEEELEREGVEGKVTLQGSAAKDTWLRGHLELDVFVLFPPKTKEWLKVVALKVLERAAQRLGAYEFKYAEHPYIHLTVEGVEVDLVPAFEVKSGDEPITAVDRTPFHTRWVKSKLDEMGKGARDEVRLLKAFFKGIGVYGAEVKVEGFSGYVTELLIIAYGGFAEALAAMSSWKPKVFVDPGNHDNKAWYLRRFSSPLIIPDPVDPKRNAAAAVSLKSLALASLAAWRYHTNPSPRFYFRPPPPKVKTVRPTYVIKIPVVPNNPPETIWGELKRGARSIISALKREGFTITRYQCWSDEEKEAVIAVESLNDRLPEECLRTGPPVWEKEHLNSFLTAHDKPSAGPWVGEDRVMLLEERSLRELPEMAVKFARILRAKSLKFKEAKVEKVVEPE